MHNVVGWFFTHSSLMQETKEASPQHSGMPNGDTKKLEKGKRRKQKGDVAEHDTDMLTMMVEEESHQAFDDGNLQKSRDSSIHNSDNDGEQRIKEASLSPSSKKQKSSKRSREKKVPSVDILNNTTTPLFSCDQNSDRGNDSTTTIAHKVDSVTVEPTNKRKKKEDGDTSLGSQSLRPIINPPQNLVSMTPITSNDSTSTSTSSTTTSTGPSFCGGSFSPESKEWIWNLAQDLKLRVGLVS